MFIAIRAYYNDGAYPELIGRLVVRTYGLWEWFHYMLFAWLSFLALRWELRLLARHFCRIVKQTLW